MKTYVKLKDDIPESESLRGLEGKTCEVHPALQIDEHPNIALVIFHNGNPYCVKWKYVAEKIEKFDEGDPSFDGEIAATIETLYHTASPWSPSQASDAVEKMMQMERGMEYVFSKGLVSVRKMATIMGCQVEDITRGL
jgi:hypothetical protein